MEQNMISVIIPVYNSAKYLKRCIDSIINQTFQNIEIILIDDGSTDGSAEICDSYVSDRRFKILHKANEGQAKARNIGLDVASGDFISFVDSDDRIEVDTFEYCLGHLQSSDVDAVIFDCLMSEEIEKPVQSRTEDLKYLHGDDIIRFFMIESTRNSKLFSPCLCLYRRKVIGSLRFREGKIYEDMDFKYKAMRNCSSIVVSNQIKYFYFVSGNSTTSGQLGKKNFEVREAAEIIYNLTRQEKDPLVRKLGEVKKARTAFSLLGRMARYGVKESEIDEKKLVPQLIAEHRKNVLVLLTAPIGLSRKILALLFAVNYNMARFLVNIRKNIY